MRCYVGASRNATQSTEISDYLSNIWRSYIDNDPKYINDIHLCVAV